MCIIRVYDVQYDEATVSIFQRLEDMSDTTAIYV